MGGRLYGFSPGFSLRGLFGIAGQVITWRSKYIVTEEQAVLETEDGQALVKEKFYD